MEDDKLFDVAQLEETATSPEPEPQTTPAPEKPLTVLEALQTAHQAERKLGLKDGKVTILESEPANIETVKQQPEPAAELIELKHNGQIMRVTPEELKALAQQGFDYTKKTQALSERERQLMAQLQEATLKAQQVPTQPQTPAPSSTAPDDDDLIDQVMATMKEKFGKDDPDYEYDPLDVKQNGYFIRLNQEATLKRQAEVNQIRAAQAEEARRINVLNSFEAEQRAADPEYGTVLDWAMQKVGNVPLLKTILSAEQYEAMSNAYATGNTAVLEKGLTYVKKIYQQQKLGLSTKPRVIPPMVQSTGNGTTPHKAPEKRDARELATMNPDQRAAWLKAKVFTVKTE